MNVPLALGDRARGRGKHERPIPPPPSRPHTPLVTNAESPPSPPPPPPADPREPYLTGNGTDKFQANHWWIYLSAMIKHIRRSRVGLAVHMGCMLDRLGKGEQVWMRLMIHMSEDIGLAERGLPASVMALRQAYRELRLMNPDGARLSLVHAIALMASARKNRTIDHLAIMYYEPPLDHFGPGGGVIPDEAFDYHGKPGRTLGRGMEHFFDHAARLAFRERNLQHVAWEEQEEWEREARDVALMKERGEWD
jgi:replication-associated recombination protein RarA